MSRTTLCLSTAAVLAAVSISVMIVRRQVLGSEVKLPLDAGTWKVTLVANGKISGDARLVTATPLDFGKQHVLRETCKSGELVARSPEARNPARRHIVWVQRPGSGDGPVRGHYEFYCTTSMARPTTAMTELGRILYAPPRPGQFLQPETSIECDHPEITEQARRWTAGLIRAEDQAVALFRHVVGEIANEPTVAATSDSARECLAAGSGDCRAKSRLLAALLRNRGIPARLVSGLALGRGREQTGHVWVEAWIRDHWLPMCPCYQSYGKVPRTYLVFGFGDHPLVRGRGFRNLDYRFLVERLSAEAAAPPEQQTLVRRMLTFASFHALPPAEQRLVEFLLLLPIAALIVCIFRNVVGIGSFGTFAPALLGLAFRELHSLPGILVFVSIVLAGWLIRRLLDRYHLLQVPRVAVLLSLVVIVLIGCIVAAAHHGLPATRYVSLFPIVILVGMIERFWTLETEDGIGSSLGTLAATMLIAVTISLVLSLHAVVNHMYRYPETLLLIVAGQLVIGRFTGYRLMELYRFRDFLRQEPPLPPTSGQGRIESIRLTLTNAR
jgi:hypothetical protein